MLLLLFQLNLEDDGLSPPVFSGTIPNIAVAEDTGTYMYNLSVYFSGATSYAIAPAVEVGWDFNTTTGILTIDTDDTDTFGPYTITATNADGTDDSNAFTVSVVVIAPAVGGGNMGKFRRLRRKYKS